MTCSVSTIATTPVKGFALRFPERVMVGADGVADNRRFALLDRQGERLRSSRHAWPCTVAADFDDSGLLSMRFPDGGAVAARVELGGAVRFDYHGALAAAHVVCGPWARRPSALAGIPLELVMLHRAGQVQGQPVTLVSTASLRKIAGEAGGGRRSARSSGLSRDDRLRRPRLGCPPGRRLTRRFGRASRLRSPV